MVNSADSDQMASKVDIHLHVSRFSRTRIN